jgi:hypothetical protein
MLTKDSTLLFSSITNNFHQDKFWKEVREVAGAGGKFAIDLSIKYGNNRFISRNGEWSLPWNQQVPEKFKMPAFIKGFNKTFTEVTDDRALEIKKLINEENQKFALMYSGGIDSTVVLVALLKNLSTEELKNVVICANKHSVVENPNLWVKYIWGKFKIIDSSVSKLDTLVKLGYRPITADEGDNLFGTVFGLSLYQHFDYYTSKLSTDAQEKIKPLKSKINEVHFSNFKDLILQHFAIPSQKKYLDSRLKIETDSNFAEQWYLKSVKNIETASIPVHTLHDFFWWQIFNVKYVNCASRCSIYLNDTVHVKDMLYNHLVNWFTHDDYQLWSMNNNNNGEKINGLDISTYKTASKKYIHDFDKNDWYLGFKLKIPSLGFQVALNQTLNDIPMSNRPNARFGLDENYDVLSIDDPNVRDFIKNAMASHKMDW